MQKPNLTKICRSVKTATVKHSPEILTGVGIAGMVTTTVMAVRATPKAIQLLDSLVLAETQEVGDRQRHPRFLTVSIMTIGIDEIRETYQEHELDTITMISFWNLVVKQKTFWKEWTSLLLHTR